MCSFLLLLFYCLLQKKYFFPVNGIHVLLWFFFCQALSNVRGKRGDNMKRHQPSYRRIYGTSFVRGADEVSCPNILSIACPKIKWFCPNITWLFARKWLFEKFGGGGGLRAAPPRTPMPYPHARYAYVNHKSTSSYRDIPHFYLSFILPTYHIHTLTLQVRHILN